MVVKITWSDQKTEQVIAGSDAKYACRMGTEAELFPEMNSRHRVELTSIQLQWCWREQQTSFLPVTKVPSNLFVLSPS